MILNMTGKGGGGTILVSDTQDAAGGTIRTITAKKVVSLQTKTITPTSSVQTVNPDTGYDGFSQVTVNAGSSQINNQNKTITPSESQQSVTADSGYTGLGTVTVKAISSTYIGSDVTRCDSDDVSVDRTNNRITVDSGYYDNTILKAMANATVSVPSSITGTGATVTTGTNTLTLSKTTSVTPSVTTSGYVSSSTVSATNSSISLTASVTTKAAATITPTTTNQTIAAGTYLTGTQTIAGDADLVASNIVSGVQIFGVTGNVVLQNYYTGSSAPASSLGNNGDLYLQV